MVLELELLPVKIKWVEDMVVQLHTVIHLRVLVELKFINHIQLLQMVLEEELLQANQVIIHLQFLPLEAVLKPTILRTITILITIMDLTLQQFQVKDQFQHSKINKKLHQQHTWDSWELQLEELLVE